MENQEFENLINYFDTFSIEEHSGLAQIEKGKGGKVEDLFYTYREYNKAFNSDTKPEWRNLSGLYNQLEEWYNNRETYHFMGAVVHLTNTSIHDVIKKYKQSSNKEALNDYLKSILKQEFFKDKTQFKEQYNPDELKYGKNIETLEVDQEI